MILPCKICIHMNDYFEYSPLSPALYEYYNHSNKLLDTLHLNTIQDYSPNYNSIINILAINFKFYKAIAYINIIK